MEDEINIVKEELTSELTGLNKGDKSRRMKWIIGLSIGVGLLLIAAIIIIIVVATRGDDKEEQDNKGKEEEDDDLNKEIIGEIDCIYEVENKNIILFGEEFKKGNSDFGVYIDGEKKKYSREYQFSSLGVHKVQLKLYSDIDMNYMFKNIKELTSVNMTSEENCKITSMISSFENCENLKFFNLTGFKADQLISMKKLFYKSGLEEFYISSFDTIALKDISYMFAYTYISSFSFNDLNTKEITDMSHLFEKCSSLLSIDMEGIDTSKVKDISYMFKSCISIDSLNFSNFDTSQIINMSSLFQECISLKELNLNFDTKNVEDMSFMFDDCSALIYLDISSFITNKVKDM